MEKNIDQKIAFMLVHLKRLKDVQPELVEDLYDQMVVTDLEITNMQKTAWKEILHEIEYMDVVDLKYGFEPKEVRDLIYPKPKDQQ